MSHESQQVDVFEWNTNQIFSNSFIINLNILTLADLIVQILSEMLRTVMHLINVISLKLKL